MDNSENINFTNQDIIGCDESGVGDYFGPVVFACAYINDNDLQKFNLKKYLIDSKKINDSQIEGIYNIIKKNALFSIYIEGNENFNRMIDKYNNQNINKVICYHKLLKLFIEKNPNIKNKDIILDQFTSRKKFDEHKTKINFSINFKLITKAESQFYNVACASIIARYYYLKELFNLEKKFNIKLPKGSSNQCKELVIKYKKNFPNQWESFIKKNFKIY